MRPATPQFVIDYRAWVEAGPPRCCHTCEFYSDFGECRKFDQEPPAEFAETIDACDKWEHEVPF